MIFGLTDICLFTQGNATKYDFDFFIEKIFVIKDNPVNIVQTQNLIHKCKPCFIDR